MEALQIAPNNAQAAYKNADAAGKKLLENLLGKENLVPKDITEIITSINEALKYKGKTREDIVNPTDGTDAAAYKLLKFGIAVLNEGWEADLNNSNQLKYEPRFKKSPSGFGLSCDGYDDWRSVTDVGVRLSYKDYDTMMHGVKIFADLYNDFLN